jgi:hypothetical protein
LIELQEAIAGDFLGKDFIRVLSFVIIVMERVWRAGVKEFCYKQKDPMFSGRVDQNRIMLRC